MPREKNRKGGVPDEEDGDSCDSVPDLVLSGSASDIEETDEEISERNVGTFSNSLRKSMSNSESVEMWLKLCESTREKHYHTMKIHLLGPFLFASVYIEDKWINWAYECKLLPSKSSFEFVELSDERLQAVDIIEDAFKKLRDLLFEKKSGGMEELLRMMEKVKEEERLEKALELAHSFTAFEHIRDNMMRQIKKKKGDVALLLAYNQVYIHVTELTRNLKDLTEEFERNCRTGEQESSSKKREGNEYFLGGKYSAAISAYSKALHINPFSYILYGNRAQSYLKTKQYRCALADGRRAVVLKTEWPKGQYRYAEALSGLNMDDRAIQANYEAMRHCKNDRDLSQQYRRFRKKQEVAGKKMPAMKLLFDRNSSYQDSVSKEKLLNGNSDMSDLPDLVEAQSSDTSNGDDDLTLADGNSANSSTSDNENNGKTKQQKARKVCRPSEPPELIEMSTEDSDSDDARYMRERQSKSQRDELLKQKRRKEKDERKRAKLAKDKREADRKLAEREKILDERKAERDRKKQEMMKKMQATRNRSSQVEQKVEKKLRNFENKKQEYQTAVKEGSRAFLSQEFQRAINHYREALHIFKMEGTQILELKDSDHMLLLYALGTAYLETGQLENIQLASKQFYQITIKYGDKFPLAYYGLGRVYQKQNRFLEALEPLHHGLELVKTEDVFVRHKWPGSETFIEENTSDSLKTVIQGIIAICKNPPKADAVCRFSECSIGRTHIYFTDFDYKGFVRLICNEACNLEFHPFCWKKFKSVNEEKSGDKDFIDDTCMTPDCSAPVVAIQIHDQDGMKTVFKSEKSKSELKNKINKQGKAKILSRPPKRQKKVKLDETRQPDHLSDHSETGGSEVGDQKNFDNSNHINKSRVTHENEEKPSQMDSKPLLDNCDSKTGDTEQLPQDPDTGVYILRKAGAEDEAQMQGKGGKTKTKKKKPKNTQSLGEFLKDHGGEQEPLRACFPSAVDDLDEIPPPNCGDGAPSMPPGWNSEPFAVPFHLQEQAETFEQDYRSNLVHSGQFYSAAAGSTCNKLDIDIVVDYVSSMLREILHANGALELSDVRIIQPLSMLPENYQDIIEKCGGVKKLLNQSTEFVFKGTKVMLSDELDSVESTEKFNGFNSTLRGEMGNGVDISAHLPPYIPYPSELKFNPDAKEFVPRTSSQTYFEPNRILDEELGLSEADYNKGLTSLSHQDPTNAFTLNLAPVDLRNFGNSSKTDIGNSELGNVDMFNGECNANGDSNFLEHSSSSLSSSDKKQEIKTEGFNSVTVSNCPDKPFNKEEHGNGVGEQEPSNKQNENLGSNKTDNGLDLNLEINRSLNVKDKGECDKNCKENDLECPLETSVISKPAANGNLERDLQKQSNGKLVNVQENVISSKSKGIQTQPLVKTKAVMTESWLESHKAEMQKVRDERDTLQEKLKDAESKQTYHQNRLQQETEKYKKKTTEYQVKMENLEKEREQISTKFSNDLKALKEENQSLTSQVKTLEEKVLKDDEKYKAQQSNLTKEISTLKAQLQSEKENTSKLSEQLPRKDEEMKKVTSYGHVQQARAQEAEVKLLELRRDVGLRFLERAFQEAHLTINNLQQAKNARHHSLPPTIKELVTAWQNYVTECHSRIVMCKSSFDEQIQLVKDGRPLNTLPPLSIPGAPQYPGPPLLQQLVPSVHGQKAPADSQPQQFSVSQKIDSKAMVQATTVTEAQKPPAASQTDTTDAAVSAMPQSQGYPLVSPSGGYIRQSVQQPSQGKPNSVAAATNATAQGTAAAPLGSSAATAVQESKTRPSNSFEKIMLRLSTMYPSYTRLELTGFIKEVRNNKHGSLTGLSLEDIVSSVKELVELKKKQGQLRPSVAVLVTNPPSRNTSSPKSLHQSPVAPTPNAAVATVKPMVVQQPAESGSKMAAPPKPVTVSGMEEEEDPCVICHEDMNISSETVTLECGHKYHSNCIRKWLMGEQSTCPTCRVHALLPDEFPRLK